MSDLVVWYSVSRSISEVRAMAKEALQYKLFEVEGMMCGYLISSIKNPAGVSIALAYADGKAVGCAMIIDNEMSVRIDPKYRRRGIARALIEELRKYKRIKKDTVACPNDAKSAALYVGAKIPVLEIWHTYSKYKWYRDIVNSGKYKNRTESGVASDFWQLESLKDGK